MDPLIVRITPLNDGQNSSYELYEDSGEDRNYMVGAFARTGLHAKRRANVVTVTIDPAKGSFPGMKFRRRVRVELPHDWPPEHVEVNGRAVAYTEDAGRPG